MVIIQSFILYYEVEDEKRIIRSHGIYLIKATLLRVFQRLGDHLLNYCLEIALPNECRLQGHKLIIYSCLI